MDKEEREIIEEVNRLLGWAIFNLTKNNLSATQTLIEKSQSSLERILRREECQRQ